MQARHSVNCGRTGEQRRCYRVERQFSAERRLEEFVRDLLRAHCNE